MRQSACGYICTCTQTMQQSCSAIALCAFKSSFSALLRKRPFGSSANALRAVQICT